MRWSCPWSSSRQRQGTTWAEHGRSVVGAQGSTKEVALGSEKLNVEGAQSRAARMTRCSMWMETKHVQLGECSRIRTRQDASSRTGSARCHDKDEAGLNADVARCHGDKEARLHGSHGRRHVRTAPVARLLGRGLDGVVAEAGASTSRRDVIRGLTERKPRRGLDATQRRRRGG